MSHKPSQFKSTLFLLLLDPPQAVLFIYQDDIAEQVFYRSFLPQEY